MTEMMKDFTAVFSGNELFRALFHKAIQNNVLLISKDGTVIGINNAFTECFGYSQQDVEGAYLSMFFTEEDREKGKPEKELQDVLNNGQAFDNNYLVSKDGTYTWVMGESVLIEGNNGEPMILKVIQNIHKQKTSEISIQKLNQFNENILASIEDAVIVVDHHLDIIKGNRAFYTLFESILQPDEKINFEQLIKNCDGCEIVIQNIRGAIDHEKSFSNIPVTIKSANGENIACDLSCVSMREEGDENNVLVVLHDITIHKQVEREREDVIAFIAHELKNPLANLSLVNELIQGELKEIKNEQLEFLLERNQRSIDRLNKMISDLYQATRVSAGHMKLEYTTFNLGSMVSEAIDTVKVVDKSHQIEITGDGGFEVDGDRHRLIQVLTNFLSNAMKYSPEKTIVTVHMMQDGEHAKISVKDEGMGIPQNQMPYIFDRFYRVDKSKHLEGIGMGLFLCRQIINAHQGKIWAESEDAAGSVFYFMVPLVRLS